MHGLDCWHQRRTKIRVINYAIYDTRGVWLAKKLRSLWNAGCDVAIIYSLSTRPVLGDPAQRLRPGSDPDAAVGDHERQARDREVQPQQVDGDRRELGQLDRFRTSPSPVPPTGAPRPSTTTSRCGGVNGYTTSPGALLDFNKTWAPKTSHAPGYGIKGSEGRLLPPGNSNTHPVGPGSLQVPEPQRLS